MSTDDIDYDPVHHVPHTPVVLALALSAVLAWLYVAYGQISSAAGVVGVTLAALTVATFFALWKVPGPRVLALLGLTAAQIGWYLIAVG